MGFRQERLAKNLWVNELQNHKQAYNQILDIEFHAFFQQINDGGQASLSITWKMFSQIYLKPFHK